MRDVVYLVWQQDACMIKTVRPSFASPNRLFSIGASFISPSLPRPTGYSQRPPSPTHALRMKDNEERRKRQKKEAKRLAKRKQQEEEEAMKFQDPDMAAMMGFGGFGGGSKKN